MIDIDAIRERNVRRRDIRVIVPGDMILASSGDAVRQGVVRSVHRQGLDRVFILTSGDIVTDDGTWTIVHSEPSARDDIDALIEEIGKLRRGR